MIVADFMQTCFILRDVLRKIFDKVTSKIEALVQRQVKQVEANGIKVKVSNYLAFLYYI